MFGVAGRSSCAGRGQPGVRRDFMGTIVSQPPAWLIHKEVGMAAGSDPRRVDYSTLLLKTEKDIFCFVHYPSTYSTLPVL